VKLTFLPSIGEPDLEVAAEGLAPVILDLYRQKQGETPVLA
jgi:hypothetical protein